MNDLDLLIDDLSQQAAPVRPRQAWVGRTALVVLAAISISVLGLLRPLRSDIFSMNAPVQLLLCIGLLTLLAVAAGRQAVRMARPQVGAPSSAAGWLAAALTLFPLIALFSLLAHPSAAAGLDPVSGSRCLMVGILSGIASLAFLTAWLRSGAPVAPTKAGWIAGLASGAVGAIAISLECAHDEIAHLGFWHIAIVGVLAVAGRLVIPPLVRW